MQGTEKTILRKPQLGTIRREHGVANVEQPLKGNRENAREKQERTAAGQKEGRGRYKGP